MVDYYALISPTIEPLANASPAERRVVYDRLVKMLDQQLRAAEPPRSDKDILKERINLEAAIRRVERRIINQRKSTAPHGVNQTEPWLIEQPTPSLPAQPEAEEIVVPVSPPEVKAQPSEQPVVDQPLSFDNEASIQSAPVPIDVPTTPPPIQPPEPDANKAHDEVTEGRPIITALHNGSGPASEPDNPEVQRPTNTIIPQPLLTVVSPVEELATDLRPGLPTIGSMRHLGAGLSQNAKGLWLRIGILALVLLALASAIGGIAEYLAQRSADRASSLNKASTVEMGPMEQKISDRLPVAPDAAPSVANNQAGATAANPASPSGETGEPDILIQRAILLEEPPGGLGDPKRTIGKVTWKLETLRSSVINSTDIGARATIDLTDAGLSASFVFRRNRDPSSANTHLIEITMTPSADNPNGKVRNITIPEMRADEKTRGTNLAGIAVPVADNIFLVGLNGLPDDMKHNMELLSERNWFMIPMRYSNGKRALLMFEKGKTGERVFEDAMQTWQ